VPNNARARGTSFLGSKQELVSVSAHQILAKNERYHHSFLAIGASLRG
jgi:hypothetical protein